MDAVCGRFALRDAGDVPTYLSSVLPRVASLVQAGRRTVLCTASVVGDLLTWVDISETCLGALDACASPADNRRKAMRDAEQALSLAWPMLSYILLMPIRQR